MQAIRTRYIGPGQHHGAKVQAMCASGYISCPWEYGKDEKANHRHAMEALRTKLGWTVDRGYPAVMVGGEFAQDWYWVFVFGDDRDT